MRTLALLATLTIAAVAFAGCSGGDGDGDSTTSSSSASRSASATGSSTSRSGTSTGSATSTSSGSGPQNQAPAGSISVSVNGTNATFALTGSDPDGDTVVWDLSFGDGDAANGTTLPANVTHAYSSAGNFSANFTVTDGTESSTYDVVVTVIGAAGAGPQVVEGEWIAGMVGCPQIMAGTFDPYPEQAAEGEGVTHVKFDVDPATIGTAFVLDVTFTGQAYLHEIDFYGADNGVIEYFPATDPTSPSDHTEGEVPNGSVFAVVYPCHPAPGSFTYTAG